MGLFEGIGSALCAFGGATWGGYKAVFGDPANSAFPDLSYGLYNAMCPGSGGAPPAVPPKEYEPPPFTGGQCPVGYNHSYTIRFVHADTHTTETYTVSHQGYDVGAIQDVYIQESVNPFKPYARYISVNAVIGNGTTVNWTWLGAVAIPGSATLEGLTLTRVDGQPDTCGDIPTPEVPASPLSGIPTLPGFPSDTTWTPSPITGGVVGLNPKTGNLEACVSSGMGYKICVNPLQPELPYIVPEGAATSPVGTLDGAPPSPPGDVPKNPGDKSKQPIVAVLVRATHVPDTFSRITDLNNVVPTIRLPRLGRVNFLFLLPGGDTSWSQDYDVRLSDQVIFCPAGVQAIAVECSPVPGVSLWYTPIRALDSHDALAAAYGSL